MTTDWSQLAAGLRDTLNLTAPPIAITFSQDAPAGVDPFDEPMPDATPDGRTGRVPAGGGVWFRATDPTFSAVPPDAASCGCAVSRVRTGMPATEMTCAIPGSRVREGVEALPATAAADTTVARYAARDAQRFA